MNKKNGGYSDVGGNYNIPADLNGNSILTGEGGRNNDGEFTCL
jgi:hypothetical protein